MSSLLKIACCAMVMGASSAVAETPVNLVSDASFEAISPAWFNEEGKGAYFAGKEKVEKAADGQKALVLQGWAVGAKILSPAFDLTGDIFSATMNARSFGTANGGSVTLVLFDEKGEQPLASFGSVTLDGKGEWKVMDAKGVKLARSATKGRLGFVMDGPQKGVRVEIDQVGLFAEPELGAVVDNSDFQWFEAELMANGEGWKELPHFATWYREEPSDMKMLSGAGGAISEEMLVARHTLPIKYFGKYRLWTRLLLVNMAQNKGAYTISLEQDGKEVARREIDDSDYSLGPPITWVWVPLDATLNNGEVQVVVTRPPATNGWLNRKIDLFVLTNQLDYQPKIADFRPQTYMRFTNESDGIAPFCLMIKVSHNAGPPYSELPGALSNAGLSKSYYAPEEVRLLAPGESSPWVLITPFLTPRGNRVGFLPTRESHVKGLVEGPWKGKLEFAIGDDRQIIKTIPIDQDRPRFLMTLPHIFTPDGEGTMSGYDWVTKGEKILQEIGPPKGKVATHLDLNAIIFMTPQVDDLKLLDRELGILRGLGFNGTYVTITEPKDAVEFQTQQKLPHFGLWVDAFLVNNACHNQPDTEKIKAVFQNEATKFAPVLDRVKRIKLNDERGGPLYTHLTSCQVCKEKFIEFLKSKGVAPEQLNASSWDEIAPVGPEKQNEQPALFYYTGLFRLFSFANLMKTTVDIKKQFLPDNIKTYMNYSPPYADPQSWDQRGTDLFMSHRNGGLEKGWTEDWLGYGGSPQQMSNAYALFRCAGAPDNQDMGGYMVAADSSPLQLRLKYYTMVAAGAREINVYAYGPNYVTLDSWSGNHALYPALSAVQHELGVIDEALYGTQRRKTDIAIVYNRASGIWAGNTNTTESDSNFIQWALSHAGYDVDYLPEEDITAGKLDNYRMVYLNGIQIEQSAAKKIAEWVQKGGVLYGGAGAGSRDEVNRPMDILDKVFGIRSGELKLERNAGRPKHDLTRVPAMDVALSVKGSKCPEVEFDRLCIREKVEPLQGTEIILKTGENEAVGFFHRYGKGFAIRLAALPGIAYLHDAIKSPDYNIETYLPQEFNPRLRNFITWPAQLAHARQVAASNAPISEITRYDADAKDGKPDRSVVFVVGYTPSPQANFKMVLPDASKFTKAYTAQGAKVKIKPLADGKLEVAFPLNISDAVVLEK